MIQKIYGHYEEGREIFKDYLLRELIGRGRYGTVYLVENRARRRALKVFNYKVEWEGCTNSGDSLCTATLSEVGVGVVTFPGVAIINSFPSPYMVDIIDYGETILGQSCVLMEHMDLSLEHSLVKEGRFSEYKASLYFTEILKGLQWQEMYGVIHRDIKPSNLFIFADTVKAGDHAFINCSNLSATDDNIPQYAFGTPAYSAPEVFDGCYSHASDRWAATVVFFQMLTGALPFEGETLLNTMFSVIESRPDYGLIPGKFHPFFTRCFQKSPRDRHSDVEEMLADFEEALISDDIGCSDPILTGNIRSPNLKTHPITTISGQATPEPPPQSVEDEVSVQNGGDVWNLRKEPLTVSDIDAREVFKLDENGHPLEYIQNRYESSADGTIKDGATGLMWQQSGSEVNFSYQAALDYINELNSKCFAGYSDWRIPTITELLSLLEPEKINGYLHISTLFDGKQQWCWSSDKRTKSSGWYLFFYSGNVNWDFFDLDNYVRAVRM